VSFDYGSFFALSEGFTPKAVRVRSVEAIADPYALTRAETLPDAPVRFVHDEGSDLHDLMGTSYAVVDLLSDRAIRVLIDRRFTGWTTYEVEIRNRGGDLIPGYQGLAVTGRCGPIDESLSAMEVLPAARPHWRGDASSDRSPFRS
jgi:hypothetical protein